jgi:hypothetical protein
VSAVVFDSIRSVQIQIQTSSDEGDLSAFSDKTLRQGLHGEYIRRSLVSRRLPANQRPAARRPHQQQEEHYDNAHPVTASLLRLSRSGDRLFQATHCTFECGFDTLR